MNLAASKDISMTFQGYVEEWNSKIPHFKFSIPCLVELLISFTSHFLPIDFIILPFTADTAKDFTPEKKATERFRTFPVTSQGLFGNFNGIYQQIKIFIYELKQFM